MSFIKKNGIWFVALLAVSINAFHYLNIPVPGFGYILNVLDHVVFGRDLVDKLFLPLVAWVIFVFWLASRKNLIKYLKNNYKAILLIFLVLLLARLLSFGRWFWQEDFQFFDAYFAHLQGLPFSRYSVGLFALSIEFFGNHFWLYNTLGLAVYGFCGIAVYIFLNKLNIDKKISLLATLFFVSSPTYFYQTVRYLTFIGQPFTLLMFIVSCYFLVIRFYPGSLIFMAAALQHGLDVSALTPVSLLLIALIFIERKFKRKLDYKLFLAVLFLLPLIYTRFLALAIPGKSEPWGLKNIFPFINLMFGEIVPHAFSFPLVFFFRWALYGVGQVYLYLPIIFGSLIFSTLLFLIVKFYLSKKYEIAKVFFLGFAILTVTNIVISRVSYHSPQIISSMTPSYLGKIPSGVTTYGLFPAFGLSLIIAALTKALRGDLFKKIITAVIIIDILTFIYVDKEFIKVDSGVQRKMDRELMEIIPNDGLTKLIFVPDISSQTLLIRRLPNFISVFRGGLDQKIWLASNTKDFMLFKDKFEVPSSQIYFLLINTDNNQIFDFSWMRQKYAFQEALFKFSSICQNKNLEGVDLKYICP